MNHDEVLRARMLLLGSGELSTAERLRAYRVLVHVSPAVYRTKLSRLLVKLAARSGPEARAALLAEAVTVAEGLAERDPLRTDVLGAALRAARDETAR